jgi:hypothetical protein
MKKQEIKYKNFQQKELDKSLLELKQHIEYMKKHDKDFVVTKEKTFKDLNKLLEDV